MQGPHFCELHHMCESNFLLCMAYTEAISLHTLEKSMMHIQEIFEEATREVTMCGFMQKSSKEVL